MHDMAIYVVICDIAAGIAIEASQAALRMVCVSCELPSRVNLATTAIFVSPSSKWSNTNGILTQRSRWLMFLKCYSDPAKIARAVCFSRISALLFFGIKFPVIWGGIPYKSQDDPTLQLGTTCVPPTASLTLQMPWWGTTGSTSWEERTQREFKYLI
jgi:hypothetical protein